MLRVFPSAGIDFNLRRPSSGGFADALASTMPLNPSSVIYGNDKDSGKKLPYPPINTTYLFSQCTNDEPYNCNSREDEKIDAIVLHFTASSFQSTLKTFQRHASQVSSHYVVDDDPAATIYQFVPESGSAWHAGIGNEWMGKVKFNKNAIGIEIVNPGAPKDGAKYLYDEQKDYTKAQIDNVIALCLAIADRYEIPPYRILAHSDLNFAKADPGIKFPWAELAKAGIGIYVDPAPLETPGESYELGHSGDQILALQNLFKDAGYAINTDGIYGEKTANAVQAFQLHYRQALVNGVADPSTIETLKKYLAARDKAQAKWLEKHQLQIS